ncbi:hypothetical protein Rleg5DRAFT_1412 [Rhizobium leguminosarum bv. viciae WSM1455]|uniref:DUF6894 family protein n=1 Tax=Rhizobium TaxID=379 RepID=UPI00027D6B08|nr:MULTISPECIES: hypothetical protein [Rhizobium]EJC64658.1 hypothetical protein Rleg5DRAFT_1412 [Rhizobium leguminosarum bv. viciae WSM1455]
MTRFYFHIRDGDQVERDLEGIEFSNVQAAEQEALMAAREMVAELVMQGQRIEGKIFEIDDENGNRVLAVPFLSTVIN